MTGEPAGRGLRLTELTLVGGVCTDRDVSEGVVPSDVIEALVEVAVGDRSWVRFGAEGCPLEDDVVSVLR